MTVLVMKMLELHAENYMVMKDLLDGFMDNIVIIMIFG